MAEATTNPDGSAHSVPGPTPQDALSARVPASTGSAQNGNAANQPTTVGSPLATSLLSSQNAAHTGTASHSLSANTSSQNGGLGLTSPLYGSRPRSSSSPFTATTPLLSSLASLPSHDRALVDQLAKTLAAQIVSQGNTATGGANGNDSSTSHVAVSSLANKPLFTRAAETHKASYECAVVIHPEISTLAGYDIRPPLTLFSNHALQELLANPASHRTKYRTAKGNATLINVGAFGREEDLGSEAWKECWKNMLQWQKGVSDVEVYERWRNHFEVLSNLSYFQDEFDAIRAFDIAERTTYFTTCFSYVAEVWWTRLTGVRQQVAAKASKDELQKIRADMLQFAGPVRTDRTSTVRHQPYPSQPGATYRRVCLRCGRPNEIASECTHSTTVHGRPVITRYDPELKTLSAINGDFDYCFQFNFGGPARCGGNHSPHVRDECSVCGGDDHHAASGNCPA
ncbi:uncharacterized protein STEHIDRAFT_153751 [Stereum hirsutum FP-91666 SS1]|uniref:uncharacterized protein n=1 Tax=Stereum hirsutum (strain FP-91666) TaxID=721885 RepID=UPI000440E164|nr:uncharacterized protein STEHIDRAFT_153751 [Stereum hirsutum FP-91666 SS1]EIM89914.1 hypothetical protein STEHIDRAFT_153751 [Stereum hirsutum FP-91666 SS1]